MKTTVSFWIALTSFLLVTLVIMVTMNLPFNWIFYLTVLGQGLIIVMVYKVLTDNYKTVKTFDDFYEDHPIGKRSN
ncbi:hypothetical protein [Maribacter sp. R77961]|uniref:hypothetical protein n=1 Tax=Maribacter sp. R77961 TaxID=3093871 RepID=UPI0037C5BAA2